jgi:hypothetical protein
MSTRLGNILYSGMTGRRLWRADHPDVHGFAVSTLTFDTHRANEADLVSADWHLAGASRVARRCRVAGWRAVQLSGDGAGRGERSRCLEMAVAERAAAAYTGTGSWPRLAVQERQPRRVLYQGMPRAPGGARPCPPPAASAWLWLARRTSTGWTTPGCAGVCGRPGRPDYAVLVSGTEPADGQGR